MIRYMYRLIADGLPAPFSFLFVSACRGLGALRRVIMARGEWILIGVFLARALSAYAADEGAIERRSFVEWILSFPWDRIGIYTASGIFGMIGHVFKKWWRNELAGSMMSYMFTESPRRTIAAVAGMLSATGTAAVTGALDTMTWGVLVSSAFAIGSTCDSWINKGAPKEPGA